MLQVSSKHFETTPATWATYALSASPPRSAPRICAAGAQLQHSRDEGGGAGLSAAFEAESGGGGGAAAMPPSPPPNPQRPPAELQSAGNAAGVRAPPVERELAAEGFQGARGFNSSLTLLCVAVSTNAPMASRIVVVVFLLLALGAGEFCTCTVRMPRRRARGLGTATEADHGGTNAGGGGLHLPPRVPRASSTRATRCRDEPAHLGLAMAHALE